MKLERARCLLLALLAAPLAALAGPGFWTGSGPDGGPVFDVQVHPTTPAIVYASTRGGLFRSVDSAASWQRIENGLGGGSSFAKFAIDRETPSTLWVVLFSSRVFRSIDGGDNWAATGYSAPPDAFITDLADAAGGSGSLLLGLSDGTVLRSIDNGGSFAATSLSLAPDVQSIRLFSSASRPNEVIAGVAYQSPSVPAPGTGRALYRSPDNGSSWTPLFDLAPNTSFDDVDYAAGPGGRLYAAINGLLYRSTDDGGSWLSTGLRANKVAAHPSVADTLLIGLSDRQGSGNLRRSTDGGISAVDLASGLSPNPGYGSTVSVAQIVLHPNYPAVPRIYIAGTSSGLYASDNDGVSFTTAQSGLSAVNVRALAVLPNPANSGPTNRRIFAGHGDAFDVAVPLFNSTNSGAGWGSASSGLRAHQIRGLAIDLTTVGSSGVNLASTVIYASGRSSFDPALRNAGLYKSSNGGSSWSVIDAGLPTSGSPPSAFLGTVRQIALDPRSCSSPPASGPCISGPLQTVFATSNGFQQSVIGGDGVRRPTFSHRIIKSTNAGGVWAAADAGLPAAQLGPVQGTSPNEFQPLRAQAVPVPLVLNPQNPQIAYVGTFLGTSEDLTLTPPSIASGVFKTVDGGVSWAQVSSGLPRYPGSADTAFDVLALAIHPTLPDTLWATAVNIRDFNNPRQGFIYKTTDGGASWSNSSTGISTDVDLRVLIVDAGNPNVLYAAGAGSQANPGSVFRSENGGANWRSISIGLPADSALALHIDPFNPTVIYAGTNAAVWQLEQVPDADGDGAPDQLESNAPNNGDGNGDNTADALQGQVGSAISLLNNREGGPAILVAGSFTASVVSGVGAGCQRLNDVQGVIAARNGRDFLPGGEGFGRFYAYPQDLVRFELRECSEATVELRFHAPGVNFAAPGYSLRFYGPSTPGVDNSIGWHDASSLATRVDARTWRLQLRANQFGSYRPADNAILFVGGPAFFNTALFANGFEPSN